jgi:hypothetical protein
MPVAVVVVVEGILTAGRLDVDELEDEVDD